MEFIVKDNNNIIRCETAVELFNIFYDYPEFTKMIKRYYAKLDYQRRKAYKIKWQSNYQKKKCKTNNVI